MRPIPPRRPLLTVSAAASAVAFVEGVAGARIVNEEPAALGFTPAISSVATLENCSRVFVKAAPATSEAGRAIEAGAALAPALSDLGPPLIGSTETDGWAVAIYEVVPGSAVTHWSSSDLPALADLARRMADVLDPSPAPATTPYSDAFMPLLGTWAALSARNPESDPRVSHVLGRPLPYGLTVSELSFLETGWSDALRAGTALHHGDIRRDNVMRLADESLQVVDWTHRWVAPGWADWVRLGADLTADGLDPEELLKQSPWSTADPHSVNVMLSGLAGRCWRDGYLPDPPGVIGLRSMQRQQGDATLRWLASRLGS